MQRQLRAAFALTSVCALSLAACGEGTIAGAPNDLCTENCTPTWRPPPRTPDAGNPNTESNVLDEQGSGNTTRFPRLSHSQWENTVQDLFLLDSPSGLAASFAPDPTSRFDTNVDLRRVGPTQWTDYQTAAEAIAARVANTPAELNRILPSNLPTDSTERARS